MNALELVNAALMRLRQPVVATLTGAPQYVQNVLDALNETAREMASAHVWQPLEKVQQITLTAGTQDYALAADHDRVLAALYQNDPVYRVIDLVATDEWARETLGRTTQGAPLIAHLSGAKIWFWYVPDAAYNGKTVFLLYQKKPAALAADADTSVFDDYVLVLGAVAKVKAIDGDVSPADLQAYQQARHSYLIEQRRQVSRFVAYRDF